MNPRPTWSANGLALLCCLLFLCVGSLWIWLPGIQTDEALFAAGIYDPKNPRDLISIFKHHVPLMVMTYVGTLKSWIYAGLFTFFDPTAASTRIPALIIGTITVWLFYRLMLRVGDARAALAGCVLLATDSVYMLTIRWDWGPVAIQHLCVLAGVLGVVAFLQDDRPWALAAGFFFLGLGLWDKALFIWSVAGLGIASLIVFRRAVLGRFTLRNAAIAVLAFCFGALPFLLYNVRRDLITFRTNANWSTAGLEYKAALLKDTLNGSALFGGVMREEWDGPLREPAGPGQRMLVSINSAVKSPRSNLQVYAFLLALALLPFVWRTPAARAAIFTLIWMAVVWAQMASVENGGTGVHHTILLWPGPQVVIAGVLAQASRRIRHGGALLAALIGTMAIVNLFVTTTYYTNLIRNGGTPAWSDAIYRVSDALRKMDPERVCVLDWGFFDNLRMLHEGELELCVAGDPVTGEARDYVRRQLEMTGSVYLTHIKSSEFNTGATERFTEFAASLGYRIVVDRTFYDSNGRAMIKLLQFSAP
jgi:4-amino-4-deoxy-L-arabinose transferase-like glycosyltransferase